MAFAHGPLAGIAPAFVTTRDGPSFTLRLCWPSLDGSVTLEARGTSVEACHEKIARLVLRLWPELEEAAQWL